MSFWQEKITIKNLSFPRFISGPLDGITDAPFRQLVREFSPEHLLYTEMRHVRSVCTPKGGALALDFKQMERPINFQVSANNTEYIAQACEKIMQSGVDAIDLNVGCPAKNVISSCSGSALMAHPEKLKAILLEFRKNLAIPFTIKIRAGFKEKNAVDIAKLAQDCGVDMLAIHPRLRTQKFTGLPDYDIAREVKQALSIPVLFSGNVVNFKTAQITYERTGVDGFLIGRGMWAQPWKLYQMDQEALGNKWKPDAATVLQTALTHLDFMLQHYGIRGLYNFRKHVPFYLKGRPGASQVREKLVKAESAHEVQEGLKLFLQS